jgi:hypothetical protein
MLTPELISREELYEAVWSEPVMHLAQALGISDVGLAKICKKLNVPRPGLGYWAKSRASRKLLKKPLPPLQADQEETYRISQSATKGGPGWSREALKHLAEEGVPMPTALQASAEGDSHPIIAKYRKLLEQTGLGVSQLLASTTCLAVSVSQAELDRALHVIQKVFEAFEGQGYPPEVLPPEPQGTNRYGYVPAHPSRTGVRIKGIFVAFEMWEGLHSVEVPAPVKARLKGSREALDSPPRSTYREVPSGRLVLEITDPAPWGMRRRWQVGAVRTLEKNLDAFFRAVMAIAEHQHQVVLGWERRIQGEEAARLRLKEEANRQAELASRLYDLQSRLDDVQQAQAIRRFAQAVRADAEVRNLPMEPASELGSWLAWAGGLADSLEAEAMQTLVVRRERSAHSPGNGTHQGQQAEVMLRNEVDLWQRRYIFGRS